MNGEHLCECGCGEPTTIHKGKPRRYVHNHHTRLSPVEYLEQDCGYETPCWVWQRSKTSDGYGLAGTRETLTRAHVAYWERENGPVPDGMELDHLCRNRACVRPSHLEAVLHIENVRRGGVTKLTPEFVRQIREWLECKRVTQRAVALMYGVDECTVNHIHRGRTWVGV